VDEEAGRGGLSGQVPRRVVDVGLAERGWIAGAT